MLMPGLAPAWLDERVTAVSFPSAAVLPYAAAIAGGIALAVLIFFWVRRGSRRRAAVTAGCGALVLVLLGALAAGHAVARQEKAGSWKANLARLGFPLALPVVPGYYPMGGYTGPDGSLQIDMGRGGKTAGAVSVFSVSMYRTSGSEGAAVLRMCAQGTDPRLTCQAEGAGLWRVTARGMPCDEVLARRPDMIVVARKTGAQVPGSVLLRAVSSLHPATAAQIAALPDTNAD